MVAVFCDVIRAGGRRSSRGGRGGSEGGSAGLESEAAFVMVVTPVIEKLVSSLGVPCDYVIYALLDRLSWYVTVNDQSTEGNVLI